MDDRERVRSRLTGEVGKLLRHRSFRDALPILRADGARPFVVGLPDDTLRDIVRRVSAVGGESSLVVLSELSMPDRFRIKVLQVSQSSHKHIGELDEPHEAAVAEECTLGMLMEGIEVGDVRSYFTYPFETVVSFVNDSVQPALAEADATP